MQISIIVFRLNIFLRFRDITLFLEFIYIILLYFLMH